MAPRSALAELACSKCDARYAADRIQQLCTCGGPLLARYDLHAASSTLSRETLATRQRSLWRYTELLPLRDPEQAISLGEQFTPLHKLERLGNATGLRNLYLKDEGQLPTASFKARGACVGVSRARELGVKAFAMPTNGNAGGAWAAYAARAGIAAHIVMPKSAPSIHRLECEMAGARVQLVEGVISDAGRVVAQLVAERGLYDASTLKEPYRIEGKKTMGFELVEQFDWDVPEVIIYPTGGGVGLIGIHKALRELREMGLLEERMPRFVAVQATGCAPIVKAWQKHAAISTFWKDSKTIAFGINVPKALGDFLILHALYESGGAAVAVDDEAILKAQQRIATTEGISACREGGATLAAAQSLLAQGWIHPEERVLLINTGSGLKKPD
ncbi:MAG TPA: threonine synthase [Candidatus Tumulicola sp.]|nr:threonine synthase [Candidatus Tumulicola sp.]